MTDPALSVETIKEIGRLYQKPRGGFDKKLSGAEARKGLEEGTLFPSITNIIGVASGDFSSWQMHEFWKAKKAGASVYEASKAADNLRDFAAARGSAVHDCIDTMMSGGSEDINDYPEVLKYEGQKYVEAYFAFRLAHPDWKPVMTEVTVYGETDNGYGHTDYGYAGTIDAVFSDGNKLIVVDWKCTSSLRQSVAVQLAAAIYAKAIAVNGVLMENPFYWTGDNIEGDEFMIGARGVQLRGDGTFGEAMVDVENGWEIFQSLRTVWEYKANPTWLLIPLLN